MPWALHLASPHCSLLLLSFLRLQDILALSICVTSVSRRYDQAMLHPLTWKYRVPLVCSEFFWDGFTVALLNPKTVVILRCLSTSIPARVQGTDGANAGVRLHLCCDRGNNRCRLCCGNMKF